MPFMRRFQGPPRAEALNHTPIRQVNNLLAELIDGKQVKLTDSLRERSYYEQRNHDQGPPDDYRRRA
jgi:hypothetical protein